MNIQPVHKASCHCGAVQFEVDLPSGLQELRRCNCSICRRRGSIAASVPLDGLRVTGGKDKLALYKFNTMTAEHYFCSICGIYTHHKRRSNRDQYGFNVACLDGVDPFELGDIPVVDGINHPCDHES
jgi:hypothetical protein